MPHLRRQPNPHDLVATHGSNAPGNLRAQFQTPPSRHTPSNPTHRPPPSTGPHGITPEPVPSMPPPTGYSNPFSIFGRQRPAAPRPEPAEDEYDFDDEYDPNAQGTEQAEEYSDGIEPDDGLNPEEGIDNSELVDGDELEDAMEDQLEDADEEMHDRERSPSPLPLNLREISSLASWTVSTSKPGCGVAALRHPSPTQYWQSDGPQPHTLTLHFFKLVAVVRIRVYLDFELDESYTPTKMIFLAGMGGNDLVEFATWEGDGPCGWVDVPLEGVGGRNGGWVREDAVRRKDRSKSGRRQTATGQRSRSGALGDGEDSDALDAANEDFEDTQHEDFDPYTGNVLKAMVIQMRVMENHQNGKDTHVRGFQVFACDDHRRRMAAAPSASADGRDQRHRRHSVRQSLRRGINNGIHVGRLGSEDPDAGRLVTASGLDEPDWMGEPVIR
ncbi:uncharacterized protein N7459_007508 [Penicillium hispanicum]|uniref:uncharacterized protein n=1 Tax=Penicillium hispanicum TaxID=1080232 RepID=UPI0025422AB4|nr:uncharacterized protein N7459_007508 [Penicillium hispanicum]KAJ5578544.1 hypothetical protein N7459_007508 [Penicillium hispanicum]